jgi:hypothetical protein
MGRPARPLHDACMGVRSQVSGMAAFIPLFGRIGPFLRPGLTSHQRRAQGQSRRLVGHCAAARSVLDGPEHGARMLGRVAEAVRGGAGLRGAQGALRPCIRWAVSPNYDAVIRIGNRAPGGGPCLERGIGACHVTGVRHLGLAYRQTELFVCPVCNYAAPPAGCGRTRTPSGISPVLTICHSAMSSLRASATIIAIRVRTRPSAMRWRYHLSNALSFWKTRNRHAS